MSKFLGFLLGVAVALAGPAVFGVLAAPGGIELNTKEMALAFGLGALIFWAVVSYFSGAGALGAFAAFATQVYCWLWIPNRTTNFLNDVPGVTNGMIDGSKQYTQNGLIPILGVISLVYAIQLIVRGVQRRRRERAEAERLQREQEAAQAQQEADVAAVYPVADGTYQAPTPYESHSRYDDLFDEPEPVQPRNQADDQTRQFPAGEAEEYEHTRAFPAPDAESNYPGEDTVAAPAPSPAEAQPAAHHEPAAEPQRTAEAKPAEAPAPVEETKPVEAAKPVDTPGPVQETKPVEAVGPEGPQQTAGDEPTEVTPPVEASQPPEAPTAAEETEPLQQTKPAAAKPAEDKAAEQSKPVEQSKPAERGSEVTPKEEMGSQYRERMDNPEDTGEFFLSSFENPAVKPA